MSGSGPVYPRRDLAARGLRPRKRLGQNFLRDGTVLAKIIDAARLVPSDEVLEVGAGTGVLTDALASNVHRLVAVELDDALYELLRERYAGRPDVAVLHLNALDLDSCAYFPGAYKLIANIPYYITGPLLRHFLEAACPPALLVLMVQRDVAERMAATPGTLSLLGVSVQRYADVEIISRVGRGAFFPAPKVESAIVRLTPRHLEEDEGERKAFFTVARAGFGVRRKQLVNALQNGLGISREESADLLRVAEIESVRRAETVTVPEWERLARAWRGREA